MIFQSLKMAWSAITSNKMRSFLTMLGIIIGVMSLVVLVSIANSATTSVTDEISNIGTNLLTVRIVDNKENPLKLSELSSFTDNDEIALAAPVAQSSVTAKSGYTSSTVTTYGTTGSYLDIQGKELAYGRFLKAADIDNHSNVVVLNEDAATEIIGRANAVGESISLDGRSFLVIGIIKSDETSSKSSSRSSGSSGSGRSNSSAKSSSSGSSSSSSTYTSLDAYIPYTTLTRMASNVSSEITTFYATATSEDSLDAAEDALSEMLLERFGQDEDAFTIQNQSTLMETMNSVTNTLALMLGGIAAISLVVGGIGIMNIMLVSVTERTKEIGIRKAIGAGRGSIMLQFMLEALMISLLGCLFGILLSWGILQAAGIIMDSMSFQLSNQVVWIAVGFSSIIGVIFGIYPANKAAKKHPIEALRYSG
ncbi:ABC transporter permease [uncultured Robinsoniella sp.]|uniref:ABC transporter permease n=1 Tax=uncultured Robinsoniella sp. TaxID=904190 RepID=UPI00374ED003